jgi:hypothetical protein
LATAARGRFYFPFAIAVQVGDGLLAVKDARSKTKDGEMT